MTHCDVFFLAGQKNATNGNAGLCAPAFFSGLASSFLEIWGELSPFFFFLALYVELGAGILRGSLARR